MLFESELLVFWSGGHGRRAGGANEAATRKQRPRTNHDFNIFLLRVLMLRRGFANHDFNIFLRRAFLMNAFFGFPLRRLRHTLTAIRKPELLIFGLWLLLFKRNNF